MKNSNLVSVGLVLVMVTVGGFILVKSISNTMQNIPIISSLFNMFNYKTETKLDVLAISAEVMEKSDLIPARVPCTGIVTYENYEERVGLDAYVKYLLSYSQEIEAIIDLSKMEITVEEKDSKVLVRMQNPKIKYNEPKILSFNRVEKSWRDSKKTEGKMLLEAMNLIPADVQKQIDLDNMCDKAKRQATNIIKGIIKSFDSRNKYSIEFEFFD